jgi:prevent-host-death family protein
MKRATISEAKNQLSALIRRVRRGEEVLILDRDVPVARLVPIAKMTRGDEDHLLAELERRGVIRRAAVPPTRELPPPVDVGSIDLVDAVVRDRDESRY